MNSAGTTVKNGDLSLRAILRNSNHKEDARTTAEHDDIFAGTWQELRRTTSAKDVSISVEREVIEVVP
jgi:hypothetical protein